MKITKSYLKQVIKEELNRLDEGVTFDNSFSRITPEDREDIIEKLGLLFPNQDIHVTTDARDYVLLNNKKTLGDITPEDLLKKVSHALKVKTTQPSQTQSNNSQQQSNNNQPQNSISEKLKQDANLRKEYGALVSDYCQGVWSFSGIDALTTFEPEFKPLKAQLEQHLGQTAKQFFTRGNPPTVGYSNRVAGNYDSFVNEADNVLKKIREGIVAIKAALLNGKLPTGQKQYDLKFKNVADGYNMFITKLK